MTDISMLEKILDKFLTHEQIVALTEEIAKGVSFLNNIIDKNEKTKAKKEFIVSTFKSIDEMIEKSSKLPASVKMLYGIAKTKTHALIEPVIAKLVTENDFSDLDDIPDVNPDVTVRKTEIRENTNQPQGEQGGRRRRRRHGRNRNNNHNVETFPETSQAKPMPQPEPKPESKPAPAPKPESKPAPAPRPESKSAPAPIPEQKPAPQPAPAPKPESKPVETFPETSHETSPVTPKPEQKPESKPQPKPRKRATKSNTENKPVAETKPAPEQKSESVEKTDPAPKKRTVRRKPKQNAD